MDKYTQHKDIDRYLSQHPEGLTTLECSDKLRITKLSTRIGEMIALGYHIIKTPEVQVDSRGKVIRRYMRYRKAAA